MEEILLQLEPRETVGKAVKALRRDNQVPGVIHDHGKDSVLVAGPYLEVLKVYKRAGKSQPVTVSAGKKKFTALIRQVDFDPKKHQLRHIVFNAVRANETVDAEVPVHIKYAEGEESAPAEKAGLVVLHQLESVEVRALPSKLPEALYVGADKLAEVGDHVTVADLVVPEGVEVKEDKGKPIATVFEPSALQAANDAAGGDAEEAAPATEGEAESTEAGEQPADAKAEPKESSTKK